MNTILLITMTLCRLRRDKSDQSQDGESQSRYVMIIISVASIISVAIIMSVTIIINVATIIIIITIIMIRSMVSIKTFEVVQKAGEEQQHWVEQCQV